ncbi:MAG: hypothetical protein MI784_14000 [Cytophagales bacterium]|nr:hypothetical protein [Cytophagales bacterium]
MAVIHQQVKSKRRSNDSGLHAPLRQKNKAAPIQCARIQVSAREWYANASEGLKCERFVRAAVRQAIIVPPVRGYPHLTIDVDSTRLDSKNAQVTLFISRMHYSSGPSAERIFFNEDKQANLFRTDKMSAELVRIVPEANAWLRKAGLGLKVGGPRLSGEFELSRMMSSLQLEPDSVGLKEGELVFGKELSERKKKRKKLSRQLSEDLSRSMLPSGEADAGEPAFRKRSFSVGESSSEKAELPAPVPLAEVLELPAAESQAEAKQTASIAEEAEEKAKALHKKKRKRKGSMSKVKAEEGAQMLNEHYLEEQFKFLDIREEMGGKKYSDLSEELRKRVHDMQKLFESRMSETVIMSIVDRYTTDKAEWERYSSRLRAEACLSRPGGHLPSLQPLLDRAESLIIPRVNQLELVRFLPETFYINFKNSTDVLAFNFCFKLSYTSASIQLTELKITELVDYTQMILFAVFHVCGVEVLKMFCQLLSQEVKKIWDAIPEENMLVSSKGSATISVELLDEEFRRREQYWAGHMANIEPRFEEALAILHFAIGLTESRKKQFSEYALRKLGERKEGDMPALDELRQVFNTFSADESPSGGVSASP